jgi:hypothetical protein
MDSPPFAINRTSHRLTPIAAIRLRVKMINVGLRIVFLPKNIDWKGAHSILLRLLPLLISAI